MGPADPSTSKVPPATTAHQSAEAGSPGSLITKAVAGLFGLGFGYLTQFSFNVVVARILSVAEAGRIFQTVAVAMFVALVTRFGMERVAMREVGRSPDDGISPGVRSLVVKSLVVPGLAATGVVAALSLLDLPVWRLAFDRDMGTVDRFVLAAAPFLSLCFVLSCLARGIRATFAVGIIQLAGIFGGSCILLLGMAAFWRMPTILDVAVVVPAAAATASAIALTWIWRHRRLQLQPAARPDEKGDWSGIGFLYLITLLSFGLSGADVIAVAVLLDEESTALYAVAARLAFSLNIGLAGINTILFSHAARSHTLGDRELMRSGVARTARWSAGISLGMAMIIGLGSPLFLALFGEPYLAAEPLLYVLLLANVFNASIGGVSVVMQMTGLEKAAAAVLAASLVLMLVAFGLFVPRFGLLGAGMATSVMLTFAPVVMAIVVRIRIGFWPVPDRLVTVALWWSVLACLMLARYAMDWPALTSALVGVIGGSAAVLHTVGLNPLQFLRRSRPAQG